MERKSSSSSRRQNSIGCMSAIFNLLSKHHKRSKFLSCGKHQQKEAAHKPRLRDAKLPIRSPTLPVEMRRSLSVDVETRPHALVARLMGLDKFPLTQESSSGADKRMKLQLGELEKCDEDLKAIERIIEVVKTRVRFGLGDNNEIRRRRTQLQQQNLKTKKKPVEEYITAIGEACFLDRFTKESVGYAESNNHEENNSVSALLWRSKAKAMIHSVDEVCKDIAWGERREIGRIGLALQHHICRDLIDEVIKEIELQRNIDEAKDAFIGLVIPVCSLGSTILVPYIGLVSLVL